MCQRVLRAFPPDFIAACAGGKPNNVDSAAECLRFGSQDNILRDALLSSVDFYIHSSSDDWRGNHANTGSLCFQTQGLLCRSQSLARIFCSV